MEVCLKLFMNGIGVIMIFRFIKLFVVGSDGEEGNREDRFFG